MSILESLFQKAGFTDYEARAYLALCQHNPQTGYELAKTSRIPRANIYEVLQKLENRGAATRVVSNETIRYVPVSPDAVLARMKHDFGTMVENIETHLHDLLYEPSERYVEQFQGYENLLSLARHQLANTKIQLLAGIHPPESGELAAELSHLSTRNIPVGVLCLHGCVKPCRACKGDFFPDPLLPRTSSSQMLEVVSPPMSHDAQKRDSAASVRSLILLSDENYLLAADIEGDKVFGLRTELPLLTKVAGVYLEQSMLLAAVFAHQEDGFDEALKQRLEQAFAKYPSLLHRTTALLGSRLY